MNDWEMDKPTASAPGIEPSNQPGSPDQTQNNSKTLDRNQALKLLLECHTLALRLAEQGMDVALSSWQDRLILKGFEEVWLAGWLNDPDLQNEAQLTPAHIATLGYLLAQQQSQTKSNK